jgi:hypothetical protein
LVESVAKDMHKGKLESFLYREAAKSHAREISGLTSKNISEIENGRSRKFRGGDYTAVPGFDEAAQTIASSYPGVIGNYDYDQSGDASNRQGDELTENLWNLIREGKQKAPAWHHGDTINDAMNYVWENRHNLTAPANDEYANIEFSNQIRVWLANQQRSLFGDHDVSGEARDSGGKWTKGGGSGKAPDDLPRVRKGDENAGGGQDTTKKRQEQMWSHLDEKPGQGRMFETDRAGEGERKEVYFKGDRAEYTGESKTIGGGLFHEVELMEGHEKGQKKWVRDEEEKTNEIKQQQEGWQEQQAGFRRLRESQNKPDQAVVNLPLNKRGGGSLDSQIDRHKREQAEADKQKRSTDTAKFKEDKAAAQALLEKHGKALSESTSAKHGQPAKDVLKTLDQMVKWEPTKALALLQRYEKEISGSKE